MTSISKRAINRRSENSWAKELGTWSEISVYFVGDAIVSAVQNVVVRYKIRVARLACLGKRRSLRTSLIPDDLQSAVSKYYEVSRLRLLLLCLIYLRSFTPLLLLTQHFTSILCAQTSSASHSIVNQTRASSISRSFHWAHKQVVVWCGLRERFPTLPLHPRHGFSDRQHYSRHARDESLIDEE